MRYPGDHHILPLWPLKVGDPKERKISLKKIPNCKILFFQATPVNLVNESRAVLFQSATNIYPSNTYDK